MTSLAVLVSLLLLIPTAPAQSTTNNTESTTATTGSTTATTGSTTMMSSSMTTMNMTTNNSSTSGNTTTPMSTSTTTTPTTTTAKPMPDIPHNTDLAMNVLSLTVSNDNTSDIQYTNVNSTRDQLLSQLKTYFQNTTFFSTELVQVNTTQMPAMYTLKIMFQQNKVMNNTQTVQTQINAALTSIDNSAEFNTPNLNLTSAKVSQFLNSTMDVCAAINICPVDYSCIVDGCRKMCRDNSCSMHGTCYVDVTANGTSAQMCRCDSEYDIEYMGDSCEYSRRGRLQIIAIIAGVLGAVILILIVVIIILCLKYNRTSAHSKYDVSTANYGNSAFDGSQQK